MRFSGTGSHDPRGRKESLESSGEDRLKKIRLAPVPGKKSPPISPRPTGSSIAVEEVYRALVLGTGDYIRKNRFRRGGPRIERRDRLFPDRGDCRGRLGKQRGCGRGYALGVFLFREPGGRPSAR